IRRKKSRRSTSFKFTEIGSPEYLPEAGPAAACPLTSGWCEVPAGFVSSAECVLLPADKVIFAGSGEASAAPGGVNVAGKTTAGAAMPVLSFFGLFERCTLTVVLTGSVASLSCDLPLPGAKSTVTVLPLAVIV